MKKTPEPYCKNCKLFNPAKRECAVTILYEGERIRIPVDAEDRCFFEQEFVALDSSGKPDKFKLEVEQVRFWVEDEEGNKTDGHGTVKIEFPRATAGKDGFFGNLR